MDNVNIENIDLRMIDNITNIYEISNGYRNMFCFTITFSDQEILNVFRKYTRSNRRQKLEEIRKEREKLLSMHYYYQKEYKNQ